MQQADHPTFVGKGEDIFSVEGLKMLLWYVSIVGIPVGWAYTIRWIVSKTRLPGTQFRFDGTVGDLYGYFVVFIFINVVERQDPSTWEMFRDTDQDVVALASLLIWLGLLAFQGLIYWRLYQYICSQIVSSSGTRLQFSGGAGPYIGWTILGVLSIFTVIGWAWVQVAFLRWQFARTGTSRHRLSFHGRGVDLLWRGIVAIVACVAIVPIPWIMAWIYRWTIENIGIAALNGVAGSGIETAA